MENKYKQIEGVWYVNDKNGHLRKVSSSKKLEELNNSIDTTKKDESENQLPSAGIGDTIAKITNFLGIKKCDACEQRRKDFNKAYPWVQFDLLEKLNEEEEEVLRIAKASPIVPYETANKIFQIYNKKYKQRTPVKFCQCAGLFKTLLERLTLLSTS